MSRHALVESKLGEDPERESQSAFQVCALLVLVFEGGCAGEGHGWHLDFLFRLLMGGLFLAEAGLEGCGSRGLGVVGCGRWRHC